MFVFSFIRRTADVKSVGYSELFVLSREDVLGALKDHPEAEVKNKYVIANLNKSVKGAFLIQCCFVCLIAWNFCKEPLDLFKPNLSQFFSSVGRNPRLGWWIDWGLSPYRQYFSHLTAAKFGRGRGENKIGWILYNYYNNIAPKFPLTIGKIFSLRDENFNMFQTVNTSAIR